MDRYQTSLWLLIAMLATLPLLAAGCAETPLDATFLEGTTSGAPTPVALCTTDSPETGTSYQLVSKSSGSCLGAGGVTEIDVAPTATGYTVEFYSSCQDTPGQRWRLLEAGFGEWYIQNEENNLNLDLEAGRFFEGTEALLYDPHTMSNQRFGLSPVGGDDFQIRASLLLTTNSCLQSMSTGEDAVTLQVCEPFPSQLWLISELDC
jgi:hypothetical protein